MKPDLHVLGSVFAAILPFLLSGLGTKKNKKKTSTQETKEEGEEEAHTQVCRDSDFSLSFSPLI